MGGSKVPEKVLVLDASERASLAIIRSLGRHGIKVIAAECFDHAIGFFSTYCSGRVIYTSPKRNKSMFIRDILRLVKCEDYSAIFPVTEYTILPLLEVYDELNEYTVPILPPKDTFTIVNDKWNVVQIAKKVGVPTPKTMLLSSLKPAKEFAKDVGFPLVLKTRSKVIWVKNRAFTFKVFSQNYIFNELQLVKVLARYVKLLRKIKVEPSFIMLQEFKKGTGIGFETLYDRCKPLALFMHERIHELPPTGGASTLRDSIFSYSIAKMSCRLLSHIRWKGLAMVEYRMSPNGAFYILEINGRPWGSLPLAVKCGIDFPYLAYKYAIGEIPKQQKLQPYLLNLRQAWLEGEIIRSVLCIIEGKSIQALESLTSIYSNDLVMYRDFSPAVFFFTSLLSLVKESRDLILQ